MHKTSYLKMKWFKNKYLNTAANLKILDVGSLDGTGEFNYREIFNEKNWKYTGLDFQDGFNVDILVSDIYNWMEVEDNTYDVVISGQLFQHLEYFWLTMSEIERVLKPGGYVCIIAPAAGPKHGGNMPNCYRFREDGLAAMAKYVDLEVLHTEVNGGENAAPWHDACLVAHKSGSIEVDETKKLENRMDNLESKLDAILKAIEK